MVAGSSDGWGRVLRGNSPEDAIVAMCGWFNKDEVLNAAIVKSLSLDDRLTISGMTTAWSGTIEPAWRPNSAGDLVASHFTETKLPFNDGFNCSGLSASGVVGLSDTARCIPEHL